MPDDTTVLLRQESERRACVDALLRSTSPKRLVLAGPGTGKTHAFKAILEASGSNENLAMSFINALVDDMTRDLAGMATVCTFHKLCKRILHASYGRDLDIYAQLNEIIDDDAALLFAGAVGAVAKIRQLEESDPAIDFFLRRGDYYGAIGFDDCVLRALRVIREQPTRIPTFSTMVVDEFQDFNAMEVAFVELCAERGNVVLAGDDDQAVYEVLRDASPSFIRAKGADGNYERFELPYCSRCTTPVVEAVNSFVQQASERGFLQGRLSKSFTTYLPKKKADSDRFPKLLRCEVANLAAIAAYIKCFVDRIPDADWTEAANEGYPAVMIIGPSQYLVQLQTKLSPSFGIDFRSQPQSNYLLEAYRRLLANGDSNLGWRLLAEQFDSEGEVDLQEAIRQTADNTRAFQTTLPAEFVARHRAALALMRRLLGSEALQADELVTLEQVLGANPQTLVDALSIAELEEDETPTASTTTAARTLKLVTYVGSKGLSAGHVFVIGLNNGDLPRAKDDIQDHEIAQMVVALTRTRKLCHVVSNRWWGQPGRETKTASEFLSWLPAPYVQNLGYRKIPELKKLLARSSANRQQ